MYCVHVETVHKIYIHVNEVLLEPASLINHQYNCNKVTIEVELLASPSESSNRLLIMFALTLDEGNLC